MTTRFTVPEQGGNTVDTWAEKKVQRIIKTVARREGISENEVRQEMQRALDAAFQNPDRKQQAFQRALFGEKKWTVPPRTDK